LEYLAAIETKATELIEAMRDDVDDENSESSPIIHNRTTFADNKPIETHVVSLPNTDDFQDAFEDDGDRPFTMQELFSSLGDTKKH
jgi:hypothetical protein